MGGGYESVVQICLLQDIFAELDDVANGRALVIFTPSCS